MKKQRLQPRHSSYTMTMRLKLRRGRKTLNAVLEVFNQNQAPIEAMDTVAVSKDSIVLDVTVQAKDPGQGQSLADLIKKVHGAQTINVSDRTFLTHLGGKIEVRSKAPLKTRDDLSMVYTPGVGRISTAIYENKERVWALTMKKNAVAIVTDGSAVLGLGNLGPEAALPVMEGKAMLFKNFGGIDAFPICLATQDTDRIVSVVRSISPGFGGINLEDISAPRCFEIERRLKETLDIPVFHDDQHGTAIVVMAALINSLNLVRKRPGSLKVILNGAGAAGVAVTRMLLDSGIKNIIGFDRAGPLYAGRSNHMNPEKEIYAKMTNPGRFQGTLTQALRGADVFIGLSGKGVLKASDLKPMARDPIVFALANPEPEIPPHEAARYARIVATGRSDFPNQINNALAFPGVFRGALDVRAKAINEPMKLAAARALAASIEPDLLREDYIIPSIFNQRVVTTVAAAVRQAALKSKVARESFSRIANGSDASH